MISQNKFKIVGPDSRNDFVKDINANLVFSHHNYKINKNMQ